MNVADMRAAAFQINSARCTRSQAVIKHNDSTGARTFKSTRWHPRSSRRRRQPTGVAKEAELVSGRNRGQDDSASGAAGLQRS
jgi:hypothetical protein